MAAIASSIVTACDSIVASLHRASKRILEPGAAHEDSVLRGSFSWEDSCRLGCLAGRGSALGSLHGCTCRSRSLRLQSDPCPFLPSFGGRSLCVCRRSLLPFDCLREISAGIVFTGPDACPPLLMALAQCCASWKSWATVLALLQGSTWLAQLDYSWTRGRARTARYLPPYFSYTFESREESHRRRGYPCFQNRRYQHQRW